jgi:hypothetical protein
MHVSRRIPSGAPDDDLVIALVPFQHSAGPDPELLANFSGTPFPAPCQAAKACDRGQWRDAPFLMATCLRPGTLLRPIAEDRLSGL